MSEPTEISSKISNVATSLFKGVADKLSAPIREKFNEIYKRREFEVFGPEEMPKGP